MPRISFATQQVQMCSKTAFGTEQQPAICVMAKTKPLRQCASKQKMLGESSGKRLLLPYPAGGLHRGLPL